MGIRLAIFVWAAFAMPTSAIADEARLQQLAAELGQVKSEFEYRKDGTLKSCEVKKSSGVAEIDVIPCEIARRCGLENKRKPDEFQECSTRHAIAILTAMSTSDPSK